MEDVQVNKKFKPQKSGRKKEKKDVIDKKKRNISTEKTNHKAFQVKPGGNKQRTLDLKERNYHQSNIKNRTYGESPPTVVGIVGPPKVGKTTLLKSLIKHYTKRTMTDVTGPVSVRAGKGRFTFIECPNDLNSFIDTAKVVDIVLLLIDASVGFEMETFEFLNIIQNHGFPKVMGVLTHLDKLKDQKKVKEVKKNMKNRFWMEVCEGSKVFYLSGTRSGLYTPKEMLNLGRFLSLVKIRPLTWKTTHSGVLVDRYEDLTNPELIKADPTINRHVCFYGYVRGTFLKENQMVHIPGVGDFQPHQIHSLEDPLPSVYTRKSLSDKFRGVYGPMSNLGDLFFDKDAVYLNVPVNNNKNEDATEQNEILNTLQTGQLDLDSKIQNQELTLLKNSRAITIDKSKDTNEDVEEDIEAEDFEEEGEDQHGEEDFDDFGEDEVFDPSRRRFNMREMMKEDDAKDDDNIIYDDDEEPGEDEIISFYENVHQENSSQEGKLSNKWKDKFVDKKNAVSKVSLFESIYGSELHPIIDKETNKEDYTIITHPKEKELAKWDDEVYRETIRNKFVTGNWNERRSKKEQEVEIEQDNEEDEEEEFGDLMEEVNDDDDEQIEDDEDEQFDEESEDDDLEALKKKREEKKKKFDQSFDNKELEDDEDEEEEVPKKHVNDSQKKKGPTTMRELLKKQNIEDPQTKLNKTEFEGLDSKLREKIEGYAPGTYIRIEFTDFPSEFGDHVDFKRPIIIGALLAEENKMGFLSMRLKKHRWFPKILKNKDPLIFSIGWRRFQSIPIYSVQDPNSRERMIKYTPKYMHCVATIYAPMVPTNTGVVAFQSLSNNISNFRLSANGYTLEFDQKINIVKKLKLIGYPREVFKNTAFITGMFNSSLEVAKFEGALLKSVSGLRGQIKKALSNGKDGDFRATFEDRILKSDIVSLRTWYPVEGVKFYNPVTNHLTDYWQAMRTVGQLRKIKNLPIPNQPESQYKPVTKRSKIGHELVVKVPTSLKQKLPWQDQEKEEVHTLGLTQQLLSPQAPITRLTEALLSEQEKERLNAITKMKTIDHHRNIKQQKVENRLQLQEMKQKVKAERELKKVQTTNLKRKYILKAEKRVKKARYTVDE